MLSAFATHPGLVRQNNEDSIRTDDNLCIYLLADGIGGHNAGEVASALAVETVHTILRSNIAHTSVNEYFELMIHAIHSAHWEIASRAQTDPTLMGMGTTLVAAVIRENRAYIANVGDSRCYLLHGGSRSHNDHLQEERRHRFTRLTQDHTVGDNLLARGIAIEQITRKQFHALTRSIGCGNSPEPDFTTAAIRQGDLLLICSDGLTDMLTDAEIETILADGDASLDTRAAYLVAAANANGGRDNISVVLVALPDP